MAGKPKADQKAIGAKPKADGWRKIPGDTPVDQVINRMTAKPKAKKRTKAESAGTPKARRASPKTVNAADRAKIKEEHAARKDQDANEPVYDPEIARVILERLSDGETLNEVCRTPGMPKPSTVRRWDLDDVDGFAAQYARARILGYLQMADDLTDIMDDGRNDWMARQMANESEDSPAKIAWQVNGEHVSRSRLRVDARKWLLSKALPKIYGDKLALTNPDGGILEVKMVA